MSAWKASGSSKSERSYSGHDFRRRESADERDGEQDWQSWSWDEAKESQADTSYGSNDGSHGEHSKSSGWSGASPPWKRASWDKTNWSSGASEPPRMAAVHRSEPPERVGTKERVPGLVGGAAQSQIEVGPLTGLRKVYKPDMRICRYDWVCPECGNVMYWDRRVCGRHDGSMRSGVVMKKITRADHGVVLDTDDKVAEAKALAAQLRPHSQRQGGPTSSKASEWSDWYSKDRPGTPLTATKTDDEKSGGPGSASYTFDPASLGDGRRLALKKVGNTGISSDLSRRSEGRIVEEEYNWTDDWSEKRAKQRAKEVAEKYAKLI